MIFRTAQQRIQEEETLELREDGLEEEPVLDPDIVSEDVEKIDSLPEPEKEDEYPDKTITQEEPEFVEKDSEEELPDELDLGLPDPEENIAQSRCPTSWRREF